MKISSPAFEEGRPIPVRHTADGEDVSVPLTWSELPRGTRSLAVLVDDPDAPAERPWVHWLIYGIGPDADGLPEGIAPTPEPRAVPGARQGQNSFGEDRIGYRGPAPPRGRGAHRYRFTLYGLDSTTVPEPGASRDDFLAAIRGHVLGTATLTGIFGR